MVPNRVSVIIPTFNRADLIEETLASINAAQWSDVEVIIIDDGSTDSTRETVAAIRDEGFRWPITYLWQENSGVAAARNAGHRSMAGEFVYHLDSDDLVHPEAFERLVTEIENSDACYAIGQVSDIRVKADGEAPGETANHKIIRGDILFSTWYTHAALYRREVIERTGGYNAGLRTGEDTEFHWRIMASSGLPAYHAGIIATRRIHDKGHLGAEASARANHHAMLDAYEAFFAACPEEFDNPLNCYRLFSFGVASGRLSDLEAQIRIKTLLAAILRNNRRSWLVRAFINLLTPRTKAYYVAVDTTITAGRWAFLKILTLIPQKLRRAAKSALLSPTKEFATP